ncbi:M4 family metallopeptidase [Pendulispora albinea]|uniref:Neutral metalloproteinase n=1 Tax=Pendulispora albinea TaxID=2741071 RepID=A0ABZ2LUG3_9BACT
MGNMDRSGRTIHCFLPPHILRNIAKNGTDQERDAALQTLALDTTARTSRVVQAFARVAVRQPLFDVGIPKVQRTIYDAGGRTELPGRVARGEGQESAGDVAVDEAYDGLAATFDFYAKVLNRNSIDDNGLPLRATVHYGRNYDNAFWNGEQMVFGDGDGTLFNRFTIALDVIAHELTHAVTGSEVGLVYLGQSGALNESVSDVFGSLVKQYAAKQSVTAADWLIGQGLFTNSANALRSMKRPGTAYSDPVLGSDPQPDHMTKYVETHEDHGGVHINSGIPNRAFYETATALGGFAWEKAGRIWYGTIRDKTLRSNASFASFARHSATVAQRLYGAESVERKAVVEGWGKVGIEIA